MHSGIDERPCLYPFPMRMVLAYTNAISNRVGHYGSIKDDMQQDLIKLRKLTKPAITSFIFILYQSTQ